MKYITQIIRLFVGIIFIISGFVKLIDPMGFSFKLQEYFSLDVLNLPFFTPYAYAIGLFVIIVELLLGVLLLLGYQVKFTLLSLIAMSVFFGFLTFYSAYFNKVTDCGCFGDAVKFTPWQSFIKDMVLLMLILFLWWKRNFIQPFLSSKINLFVLSGVGIICLVFAKYTNDNLPIIDFRAYKIGVNVKEAMTIPADAEKPVFEYNWKFNIAGKEEIITTNGDFPDVDGDFISVKSKKISDGYKPPIHDFSMEKDGEDYTEAFLQEPKLVLVISYDIQKSDNEGFAEIKSFTDKALKSGYKVVGLTASMSEAQKKVKDHSLNFDFYFTDQTTLKTIIRSNPAVMILEKGTIKNKVNWRDVNAIELGK